LISEERPLSVAEVDSASVIPCKTIRSKCLNGHRSLDDTFICHPDSQEIYIFLTLEDALDDLTASDCGNSNLGEILSSARDSRFGSFETISRMISGHVLWVSGEVVDKE
jgi:hypothetical protein